MPTVEVVTDMVTGLHMVTTTLVYHIWEDHNHLDTLKITMLTDINHTLLGVLGVTVHSLVTEVHEVEKA